MKNLLTFFVTVLAFLMINCVVVGASEQLAWDRKLPFKNATIQYEITGMEKGTETLSVKDYGKYRALHHDGTTTFIGMSTPNQRLEITDPDWHYTFDLVEKTGTKVINTNKFYQEEYDKLSRSEKKNVRKNTEELGISMVKDFNGQMEVNATEILGYSCDRTTIMGMTVNVIHKTDVPLLSEMNIMGMKATIKATSIDLGKPSADAFALPADINAIHDIKADAAARQMVKSYIDTLKEPDGAKKMRNNMNASTSTGKARMSPSPSEAELPPEAVDDEDMVEQEETYSEGDDPAPNQDELQKSMEQGMQMLKGLFGN